MRNGYLVGDGDEYEHRVVYERRFIVFKGFHVHHKNGNAHDNRPENLEAISPADHSKLHSNIYQRGEDGGWLKICHACGVQKSVSEFYKRDRSGHRRDCKPCQHKIVNAYNKMRRKNLKVAEPACLRKPEPDPLE